MKIILAICLAVLVSFISPIKAQKKVQDQVQTQTQDQAQNPDPLVKYYFGFLGNLSAPSFSTNKIDKDGNFRGGVVSEFYLNPEFIGPLKIHSRLIFDQSLKGSVFNPDLRLIKSFGPISLAAVYSPTLARIMFLPHPLTNAGQFLPSGKQVVSPANRLGLMTNYSVMTAGAYVNKGDSLEFHFGLDKKFSGLFKRVAISAFTTNYQSISKELVWGGAATIEVCQLKAMVYGEKNELNVETYSGVMSFDLDDNWSLYGTMVRRNQNWQHLEIGTTGVRKSETGPSYLYGVGYQVYPDKRLSLYLQVWLEK